MNKYKGPTGRNGPELRHLRGAVANLVGSSGRGTCFFRSAALVLDVPGTELCFGILAGATDDERAANLEASTTSFIHSWVEWGATVYSPTQIEREGGLRPWPRAFYYETNGVTGTRRIKRPALLRISREIGLSAHLRLGRPLKSETSFVFDLLDTAGLPYAIAQDGGLVPPEFGGS